MKPAPFTYHRPDSREEVDAVLGDVGEDGKVLAGGQSLIPILNMRLAAPAHVVDINYLRDDAREPRLDGEALTFGPLVRQETAERAELVAERAPLLREALRYVAHPAVRSRGTVVGGIAHADPAGELPALLLALGGEVRARGTMGSRTIHAADLFAGPLETSLRPGEWIDEVRLPQPSPGAGYAVEEFARRHGDYALCGVLATATPHGGRVSVMLVYLGVGDVPTSVELSALPNDELGASFDDTVRHAVGNGLDPGADLHASAAFRRRLAERLGVRAARRAVRAVVETS